MQLNSGAMSKRTMILNDENDIERNEYKFGAGVYALCSRAPLNLAFASSRDLGK